MCTFIIVSSLSTFINFFSVCAVSGHFQVTAASGWFFSAASVHLLATAAPREFLTAVTNFIMDAASTYILCVFSTTWFLPDTLSNTLLLACPFLHSALLNITTQDNYNKYKHQEGKTSPLKSHSIYYTFCVTSYTHITPLITPIFWLIYYLHFTLVNMVLHFGNSNFFLAIQTRYLWSLS